MELSYIKVPEYRGRRVAAYTVVGYPTRLLDLTMLVEDKSRYPFDTSLGGARVNNSVFIGRWCTAHTMKLIEDLFNSNKLKYLIKEVYMWKDKVKNILWFLFVYTPLVTANGLGCIILANEKIVGGSFQVVTFRKTKRQIDKEKFAKFMKRVCK